MDTLYYGIIMGVAFLILVLLVGICLIWKSKMDMEAQNSTENPHDSNSFVVDMGSKTRTSINSLQDGLPCKSSYSFNTLKDMNTALNISLTETDFVRNALNSNHGIPSWKLVSKLGSGAFSDVYHIINLDTTKSLAMKYTKINCKLLPKHKCEFIVKSFLFEANLLSTIKHENIIGYYGNYMSKRKLCLYLELGTGGSLFSLIKFYGKMPLQLSKLFIKQLLCGLKHLHELDVIHRDIKSHNLLLNKDGILKIADFGSACRAFEVKTERVNLQGTFNWMAPEMIKGYKYNTAVDIWSTGCVMIEMLSGQSPWNETKKFGPPLMFHIATVNSLPDIPKQIPKNCKHFIECCLNRNYRHRSSAKKLVKHKFFADESNKIKEDEILLHKILNYLTFKMYSEHKECLCKTNDDIKLFEWNFDDISMEQYSLKELHKQLKMDFLWKPS